MANWIVTSGIKTTTGATSINNQTTDMVIKAELANGEWSEAFIKKENFKIGGGTETESGSCIWNTGSGSWNVDGVAANIDQVEFLNFPYNNSEVGLSTNQVVARCTFNDIAAPNVNTTYKLDIDENTATPIAYSVPRKVCYKLKLPYDPQVAYTFLQYPSNSWSSIQALSSQGVDGIDSTNTGVSGLTRTLTNATTFAQDGYYMWRISGEIQPEYAEGIITTLKFAVRRANNHMPIDTLDPGTYEAPFDNPPDFSVHTHSFEHGGSSAGASGQWSTNGQDIQLQASPIQSVSYSLYPHQALNFYREGSGSTAVDCFMAIMKVRFNPMEGEEDYANDSNFPDPANYCDLGHQFNLIEVDVITPEDPPGLVISNVIAPTSLTHAGGDHGITVTGTEGAEYRLCLQQASSLTSIVPASSSAHHNFAFKNFAGVKRVTANNFTLPASGVADHTFRLPSVTADTRYDIFVEPRNTTTILSGAASQVGDLTVTQLGTKTLTLYPKSQTNTARFVDITGNSYKITKTMAGTFDNINSTRHVTARGNCLTAVSSSTRLVLKTANPKITIGMYVTIPKNGNGIPHLTTVSSISGRVITLSAASTIAAKATVRFDAKSSKIFPFTTIAIAAAGGTVVRALGTAASTFLPDEAIGNLYSSFSVTATANSSGGDITLASVNQIPDTGITNKYIRGRKISDKGNNYVQIKSKSGLVVTVNNIQSVSDGDVFEVIEDPESSAITSANGQISVIHVQADHVDASPDTCTVSGYLDISSIPGDISLPINLDALISNPA